MISVDRLPLGSVSDEQLRYAVIVARHQGKLLFVRHHERSTFEVPGGHREPGETPLDAARRELQEETGAVSFDLRPRCIYSVTRPGQDCSFGLLCEAEVHELGPLPESEIAEVILTDTCPEQLTYPEIQPQLLMFVQSPGRAREASCDDGC